MEVGVQAMSEAGGGVVEGGVEGLGQRTQCFGSEWIMGRCIPDLL